ncbi:response regulator [Halothermothrix orenii]|uniref:Stage 0 sporulation protein A homolog n=1 Tax=Halothermothrix orenii (strain H 168 / OCM 544 / DSM 9562) TaxID=373903 RepID=B8CZJ8_HALOH|nr:response regulator transcription factor [Halothermothrix orenii]ACL70717.1 two component transcriptional regulator, LuxR family [Halothermothrix orenii H 168]
MIQVYLVDDHPFVLQGLKAYLNTREGIEIVGTSGNGEKAIKEIAKLNPEVAVVDLRLPGLNGIEVTREIKKKNPGTEVIILSSFNKEDEVIEAIDAGALSYVMKDSRPEKLVEAIKAARRGEPVLTPGVAKKIMKRAARKGRKTEPLTPREKEVLACLVRGNSNRDIAKTLCISETTVKTHVSNILKKLDVKDRTQAVIKAIENNLVDR